MTRTILIVEDNSADSQLLLRAFEKARFDANLVRIKDGDDAISYLDGSGQYGPRDSSSMPSMVLLDIKLPRRSGFEVLSWIRKDSRPLRRLPVIILTSSRHSIDINRAYELGANAYTVKPDTSAQLVSMVECIKTFWMYCNEFPLVAPPGISNPEMPPDSTGDLRRRVLLIEDERTDALLITKAFARAGFLGSIEHVPDGRTALAWLDERIATGDRTQIPVFVLLDLKLPGIPGLDLLERIRSRPALRTVPIVVLATAHDSNTINQAYERGANSYLVKSPDPEEIARLVTFVKQYWLTVNQSSAHQPG